MRNLCVLGRRNCGEYVPSTGTVHHTFLHVLERIFRQIRSKNGRCADIWQACNDWPVDTITSVEFHGRWLKPCTRPTSPLCANRLWSGLGAGYPAYFATHDVITRMPCEKSAFRCVHQIFHSCRAREHAGCAEFDRTTRTTVKYWLQRIAPAVPMERHSGLGALRSIFGGAVQVPKVTISRTWCPLWAV
jgi:hypothetical protein